MDTAIIEKEVDDLIEGVPLDAILAARERAMTLYAIAKRVKDAADEALLKHLAATGKPIELGENLILAASSRKDVKCRDNKKAMLAMFDATGGDIDAVAECLGSNPWKHGACRLPLGEKWDEHFETILVPFLKEGQPSKKLVTVNKTFLK